MANLINGRFEHQVALSEPNLIADLSSPAGTMLIALCLTLSLESLQRYAVSVSTLQRSPLNQLSSSRRFYSTEVVTFPPIIVGTRTAPSTSLCF